MKNRVQMAMLACIAAAMPAMPIGAQEAGDAVDRRWLERLDDDDRVLLDGLVGFAPPAFRDGLQWIGGDARTWDDMRGSVVVIQTWTSKNTKGRSAPLRATKALEESLGGDDLHLLALHTPDGADNAPTFLERRELPVSAVIDASGAFCDDLGAYREPVNVVVDRNGIVRYVGLKIEALPRAVEMLVAETFDPSTVAPVKDQASRISSAEFPEFRGTISSAVDVRGKSAPEFRVNEWITNRPDMNGKVVVLDFWATWCPPCIASIPHLNDLSNSFREDAVAVGVSDEQPNAFYNGMREKKLTTSDFAYALALDPRGRMKSALRITGIPHCIVVSSDGIVRWQGHPASLRKETLGQIVQANRVLTGNARPRRWGSKG